MNPDIKEKGGEKKNLKMEEETLVAFGIILVLFLRRRRQQRLKNRRRKEWVRPIFQQEAKEYMASTTTSSESFAWVIGNIISGKYNLTFQIYFELMTGQSKQQTSRASESSRAERSLSINL